MKPETLTKIAEMLDYNPETGVFTWLVSRGTKKAGSEAGCVSKINNYVIISVDGKLYLAHRLGWLLMTGEWPDEVDHINHNGLDNRWVNLRNVDHRENGLNNSMSSKNKSGCTGVCWHKKNKRWSAQISSIDGRIHLGSFKDIFEAACARKSAENKHNYHENHGL